MVASQHRQTHQIGGRWKMFSIPRHAKGNYDWNALADGRYYVEWYVGGTRRRVSAGVTAAQAIEVKRRKHHELQGRKLGIPGFETAGSIYQGVVCFADRQWAQRDSWPEARRSSHEALATIRTRDPLSGARLRSIEQSGNSSKPGAILSVRRPVNPTGQFGSTTFWMRLASVTSGTS